MLFPRKSTRTFALLTLLHSLSIVLSSPAYAIANSPDSLWSITQNHAAQNKNPQSLNKNIQQKSTQASPDLQLELEANLDALLSLLDEAPLLSQKQTGAQGVIIYLPLANGSFSRFEVFNNPIIKTSKKNQPAIKTYKAFGLDQKNLVAHLDLSTRGFHAMIRGNGRSFFIDPELQHNHENYKHYGLLKTQAAHFSCGAIENPSDFDSAESFARTAARSHGSILRTYDLAVVATPSYSSVFTDLENPNKAEIFNAIVTAINRVNLVFNQDLAIQLNLLEEHDLIFTDSSAEDYPFTNNINQDLSKITKVISDAIGSNNYDVGHMLTKSDGGIAFIKSVCNNNVKGAGVTGTTSEPYLQSEYFFIDYIAHELGHQFGANHSFNSNSGTCDTRNASTAVEPGSGSTIMGYAGICGSQNLQSHSDDYFHTTSINEILNHINNQSCHTTEGSLSTPLDHPPEFISHSNNHTIPSHTAFYLQAEAIDIDGGDIFYSWEQTDTGTASKNLAEMHTDFGSNPLFRSLMSEANQGKRFFPAFNHVIQGTTPVGETYPTRQRQLNYTVTARSQPYGSSTEQVNIKVTKTDEGFVLLHPANNSVYPANQTIDLYWNTANTENNPVSCKKVDIYYSDSNSQNRDDYALLEANVVNDGMHSISGLSVSNHARLLIECADNIFYSAGSGKFILSSEDTSYFSVTSNKSALAEGNSGEKTVIFTITRTGDVSQTNSIDFNFTGYGNHAADSSDYTPVSDVSGTVSFEAEQSSHSLEVVILGDTLIEENESFQLVISNPLSGYISKAFAPVMILNDDHPPVTNNTNSTRKSKSGGGGSMLYLLVPLFFVTLKRKTKLLLCVCAGMFISACAPQQEKSEALHPQAQKLVWVEHANAKQDVEKNFRLHGKESKFLGFSLRGHIQIPGLVEEELEQALKQGYILQEGMGDVIFSEKHMYLREQFFIYASEYNRFLTEKLFGN